MKKLVKSVLMLSIASLAILSSCKKDDDNAEVTDVKVAVTVTPEGNVTEGTPITIKVVATGNTENKLKSISVTRSQAGSDDKVVLSKSLTGSSAEENIIDTPLTGTYNYTVAITGEKGSPATKTVTVKTLPPPGPIVATSTAVPLFGHANGAGSNANFMRLKGPSFNTYSTNTFDANKANVDLAFYFGNSNKATLTSPSDPTMQGLFGGLNWSGVNVTQLYKTSLTVAQYNAIATGTNDAQITEMASNVTTWVTSVNLLAAGNVLLFKTASNRLGLIKVEAVVGTNSTDGEIDLAVVVQDN